MLRANTERKQGRENKKSLFPEDKRIRQRKIELKIKEITTWKSEIIWIIVAPRWMK